MRKTLALTAAALLGTVTLAAAQPAPPPPAPPGPPPAPGAQPGPERPGPGPEGMEHHMGPMHGMMGGMRGPRGARFVFERNGAAVDVRCAENEPMRACVDAASVLIDKLAQQAPRQ